MVAVTTSGQATERMCPQCGGGLAWPDYADMAVCGSCGSTLTADAALRALQCPQCAGPLAVVGSTRLLGCCHCGVQLLVAPRGGYERWRLPVRADRVRAEDAAERWLRTHPGVAKAAREATFTRAELVYLPIWEYRALVAGWEFGHTTRICSELVGKEDSERLELRAVREVVKDGHLRERRLYQPAADPAVAGATRPRLTGREPLLPVFAGDLDAARLLPVQGAEADILVRGRHSVLQPTSGAERGQMRSFALHETVALLFYPLWRLEYCCGGRSYHVVVNGFDGTVNAALAPASAVEAMRERLASLLAFQGSRTHGTVEYHDPYSS